MHFKIYLIVLKGVKENLEIEIIIMKKKMDSHLFPKNDKNEKENEIIIMKKIKLKNIIIL